MLEVQHLVIALVEPSPVQSQIICKAFRELGIDQVKTFTNGTDLLEHLKKAQPDVVVSSFYLPDMTGTELVFQIRGDTDIRDTPFILISSETNPRLIDPIRQAGTMAILPKPFTPHQLDRALNATLDYLNVDNLTDSNGIDFAELNVLIVDDSVMARRHIRTILERLGIEKITESWCGKDAIPIIDSTLFDLIFTDYNMPIMDGKELVEYIRTKSMQSSVPVFMVSSESNSGRLSAVQEAGVSAICDKPFETEVVRNLLLQFLRQS